MHTIIRQAIGIDCSKDTLDCCYGKLHNDFSIELHQTIVVANTPAGFKKLLGWTSKHIIKELPIIFVVEATGVYYEQLANYLTEQHHPVSVVLPNRISNFIRTTTTKTITDRIAAQNIAQFALEKKLEPWQKPNALFLALKQLTRERSQLIEERTAISNQLHAEQHSAWASSSSIRRMKAHIAFINKQIKEIEAELSGKVNREPELKARIDNVCTTPGINILTVTTVLGETNGFELIRSKSSVSCWC